MSMLCLHRRDSYADMHWSSTKDSSYQYAIIIATKLTNYTTNKVRTQMTKKDQILLVVVDNNE